MRTNKTGGIGLEICTVGEWSIFRPIGVDVPVGSSQDMDLPP
jgi:hypothetical protein